MKKLFFSLRTFPMLLAIALLLCANISAEVLQEITVKEGDTLWSVANFYLKTRALA